MANRTDPQSPVEKSVLTKIHQSTYWKEHCFGLTAETLVEKAMELDHIGGTFGGNRDPTPFMCLVMKMLQIQPEKEIVIEFIKHDDYKYVQVLGAFYLRLTGTDIDVYQYLEPLCNDKRELWRRLATGYYSKTNVGESINELLKENYSCDIAMPRIKKRWTPKPTGSLELRESALEEDFEDGEKEENDQVDGSDDEDNKGRPDLLQTTAHGTTAVAIFFKGGILIGSDARVTEDILESDNKYNHHILCDDYNKIEKLDNEVVVAFSGRVRLWKLAGEYIDALEEKYKKDAKTLATEVTRYMDNIDVQTDTVELWFAGYMGTEPRLFMVTVEPRKKQAQMEELKSKASGQHDSYTSGSNGAKLALPKIRKRFKPEFTIEQTLELLKNEILESALLDPYTGGRIRAFHVSAAVSHKICDDRLLDVYLTFLRTAEKDKRSILVLVLKESSHVTTNKLAKHFTTFSEKKWAKCPPRLAILGDRNYLYRVRFMSRDDARHTFTKLHNLHSKYENDRRKEFEGMICHWIDEKTCVYAQIPSEELVRTLLSKFPDCDSKDVSLSV